MAPRDLTLGIQHLNTYGRLVCLVGLAVHAGIAYALPYILLLLVGMYAVATYAVYCVYTNFAAVTRYDRSEVECPSNSTIPKFSDSLDTRSNECIARRGSIENSSDAVRHLTPAERALKKRAEPRPTLAIDSAGLHIQLQDREGDLAALDHVGISWWQFLNAYLMIAPSAFLLQIIGLTKIFVRRWLHRRGLVKPIPVDYGVQVAEMCLGIEAIHFHRFKNEEETIAIFTWHDVPYVVSERGMEEVDHRCADNLVIDIDLKHTAPRMIKATLDDRELAAGEAFILVNYFRIFHNHPKIHSLANWALDTGSENAFIRWNSVVTVIYNYFGATWTRSSAVQLASCLKAVGILKYDFPGFGEVITLGLDQGIQPHGNIRKLAQHSKMVKFVIGLRNIFLNEFQDYKEEFMGVDGEALFVGTCLHSLQHSMWPTEVKDILWMDIDHPEFGFMAECSQYIHACMNDDLPLLPFNRHFRTATHPFYKAVYEGARQLNPWFAERMDTCIIK